MGRNEKKNNCIDISSDKLVRLQTGRVWNDYEKEISKEKMIVF